MMSRTDSVILQKQPVGTVRPTIYSSCLLNIAKRQWDTTQMEFLATIWSVLFSAPIENGLFSEFQQKTIKSTKFEIYLTEQVATPEGGYTYLN